MLLISCSEFWSYSLPFLSSSQISSPATSCSLSIKKNEKKTKETHIQQRQCARACTHTHTPQTWSLSCVGQLCLSVRPALECAWCTQHRSGGEKQQQQLIFPLQAAVNYKAAWLSAHFLFSVLGFVWLLCLLSQSLWVHVCIHLVVFGEHCFLGWVHHLPDSGWNVGGLVW